MSFFPSHRSLVALSCALTVLAGCQATSAVAPATAPVEETAALQTGPTQSGAIDPATRALLDAVAGMASAGSTFEQDAAIAPLTQPQAGYAVQAVAAVAPATVTTNGSFVTGAFPAAASLPATYQPRAVGGWLTANPLVYGNTSDTYYTPGGTTAATAALVSKTVVNSQTTNEVYVAPWKLVTDLPAFFKAKLSLPGAYTVQQAEETYTTYTNGAVTGSAVGYRWNVVANGVTVAWVRSQQVTQPDGSKVDHWEVTGDYQTVAGKLTATKTQYGTYWEASRTGNEVTRVLNAATGVATATGTWQDVGKTQSVAIADTIAADGSVTRKLTRALADGRSMVVNETYAANRAGAGTVLVAGAQVGTLTWAANVRGSVTLNGATQAYIASRLNTKDRPQVLDLVPPSAAQYALSLKGSGGVGASPDLLATANNFTYEFWVKPTMAHEIDSQSNSGITGTSGQHYAIWPAYGVSSAVAGVGVSVGTNGVSVYGHTYYYMPALLVYSGTISSTAWTHVAVVVAGDVPSLYLNGTLVKTGVKCTSATRMSGYFFGGQYGNFVGGMDDLRLWNVARTGAQIQADMNRELSGTESGLYGYWKFNEGTGTALASSVAAGAGKFSLTLPATWNTWVTR